MISHIFYSIFPLLIVPFFLLIGCDESPSDDQTPMNTSSEAETESQASTTTNDVDEGVADEKSLDESTTNQNQSTDTSDDESMDINDDVTEVDETMTEVDETMVETQSEVTFMPLSEANDVVSFVDINRYMGTWYEIATTPSFQQRSCYETQAHYTFNETEGWVDVTNRCKAGSFSARVQEIQGKAEVADVETQAKLIVTFFNQGAPYWIVELDGSEGDEPYQWAVVSVPNKQTMWILSRTIELSVQQRNEIEMKLLERGFPIDRLIDTPQIQP